MAPLYANILLLDKKKNRENNLFVIAPFKTKCVGIHLIKEVKDLCNENFKTLKRELNGDPKPWKDHPCSWPGRINILKKIKPLKLIYRFNFWCYIPESKFTNISQYFTNFSKKWKISIGNHRRPQIAKAILPEELAVSQYQSTNCTTETEW